MGNKKFDKKVYTGGNITVNTATPAWANLSNSLDLTLHDVKFGDLISVSASGIWGAEASNSYIDVVSLVAAAPVNSWSESFAGEANAAPVDANVGVLSWFGPSGVTTPFGGEVLRAVNSSDIVDGLLVLRFRTKTLTAANRVLNATTVIPFTVSAVNLGQ